VATKNPQSAGAPPTLTDGVVVLDGHRLSDVAAHVAGEDEEQARRFGWYPARSTPERVRAAFIRWRRSWRRGGRRRTFAVRDGASGELAGGCEVRLKGDGIAHVSYWTFPPFRGRGLASRAVRLVCAYAFAHLGVERIELYVETDNLASRGVARKAGFVEEGVLREYGRYGDERRDMVLYSRLPTDPEVG
jgi:RimJ/RimL family protein N-acetyltransferase